MRKRKLELTLIGLATVLTAGASVAQAGSDEDNDAARFDNFGRAKHEASVQVGPRPYYLVQGMDPGKLKDKLLSCQDGPFRRTDFSIGRGAALEFAEHTKEAYQAGARMGAGIVECDVTFTKDGELVCRHDECQSEPRRRGLRQPGEIRAEDDRHVQGGRRRPAQRLRPVLQQSSPTGPRRSRTTRAAWE